MLTVTGFSQLMAIRLDLGENSSEAGEDGEVGGSHVDLCIIRYGDDGVLQMSPDFSSGKMPYKIDVKTGAWLGEISSCCCFHCSCSLSKPAYLYSCLC